MLRKLFLVLAVFFMIEGPAYSEIKANGEPLDIANLPPVITTDAKGNVYIAYYAKDGSLMVKRAGEPEVKVAVEGGMGTSIGLAFSNDDVVLVWRPKLFTSEKFVYAQRSTDGGKTFSKPVVVNNAHGALPPVQVFSDGKNRMYVLWEDERVGYRTYMNSSTDGGRTFAEKDTNLTPEFFKTSLLPYLVADGDTLHFFFLGVEGNEKKKVASGIFYRQSKDGGKTWSDAVMIQGLTDWAPAMLKAVKSGQNLLVFWAGVRGVHGSLSTDGREWKSVELKDADMKDVDRFSVDTGSRGGMFIVASWKKGAESAEKASVFFYRSEDNGATWSAPRKMNTNEYDNTSSYLPAMHVRDDGTIFIAWEDHRDIRGDIYINYSKDSGKTWLEKEISLSKGQGKQNNSYPFIAYGNGTYHVLWLRYADDRLAGDADLFVDTYTIKENKDGTAGGKR